MSVSFEGFPRTLQRGALRAGRWFVAADGLQALLCFATDILDADERIAVVFGTPGLDKIEVVTVPISALREPFGTVEDEVVFAPGQTEGLPMLVAPLRRTVRHGALLRLASGDLGVGLVPKISGKLMIVSLTSGQQADRYDLVFDRWSLALRRRDAETRLGYFKPHRP
ncbi:hypothetical protein [Phenylobacterium sp.]|uniref:hypothetical protein n=1 Tax=Phenylobacterium sp. TaxID=1871053 RepID=UPI00286AEFD6|nr:hypothetical protein [Phenylobacterium sp.]